MCSAAMPFAQAETNSAEVTLASIQRIDPHPAYSMVYAGDYDLDGALVGGISDDTDILRHIHALYGVISSKAEIPPGKACTGFTATTPDGSSLFAHNEDWEYGEFLVLFTKPAKGHASASIVAVDNFKARTPGQRAEALSAPFYPLAGMNDAGLAVSTYSVPTHRATDDPTKRPLIWPCAIRLLLDRASTLDEAIELLDTYNILIEPGHSLQLLVGDSTGTSAVIAWVEGALTVAPRTKAWQAVANFTQANVPPEAWSSGEGYERWLIADNFLGARPNAMSVSLAFEVLKYTAQKGGTQFSVEFDQTHSVFSIAWGRAFGRLHRYALDGHPLD